KARVEFDTNGSSGTLGTQVEASQPNVLVSDPIVPVKIKGRPKVATRIKSRMEVSMNSRKQRTSMNLKKENLVEWIARKSRKKRELNWQQWLPDPLKYQI
ncbi:hypothetical protein Tco_0120372, partial [Tanacetum coccineum]